MKPLEKSITLVVSLKVAVGNVKYIFNIDILVIRNKIILVPLEKYFDGGAFWYPQSVRSPEKAHPQ